MGIPILSGREFATKFALHPERYGWLLGAGASASAGIPTGYDMISDFKASLFSQQTGVPRKEIDSTDPIWVDRINAYFAAQGTLPPAGDPGEYAKAFEAVYPNVEDRRTYIARQVKQGHPSFAHRVLAGLLATGRTPCAFTTNFDDLVETATTIVGEKLSPSVRHKLVVAAIDSAERAARAVNESDWPLLAKIHGDYQSVSLKNTEGELATQDDRMRSVLSLAFSRFALVVVGYSGRDVSVMEALSDVLRVQGAYPGGVYWVTRSASGLLPAVERFLQHAVDGGVSANVVVCPTFDELAGDIAEVVKFEDELETHIKESHPRATVRQVVLPVKEARNTPILRCSALRVGSFPSQARRLSVRKSTLLPEVRELLKVSKVNASVASIGRDLAVFGPDEKILEALAPLGAKVEGTIALVPTKESWALGLIYDALVKALCRGRPLQPRLKGRGHSILVSAGHPAETAERRGRRLQQLGPLKFAYGEALFGRVPSLSFPFSEALQVRLEEVSQQWWCVFDPYTNVDLPKEDVPDRASRNGEEALSPPHRVNPAADWLRERWAQRYNKKWSAIIDAWSEMLAGEARAYWLEEGQGIDAVFEVGAVSAWSRPSHDHSYFHRTSR